MCGRHTRRRNIPSEGEGRGEVIVNLSEGGKGFWRLFRQQKIAHRTEGEGGKRGGGGFTILFFVRGGKKRGLVKILLLAQQRARITVEDLHLPQEEKGPPPALKKKEDVQILRDIERNLLTMKGKGEKRRGSCSPVPWKGGGRGQMYLIYKDEKVQISYSLFRKGREGREPFLGGKGGGVAVFNTGASGRR